jgi:hypothetical protein
MILEALGGIPFLRYQRLPPAELHGVVWGDLEGLRIN